MLHPLLQQQYELHRKRLEQCCERPVEQVLYHGTAVPTVPDICAHGFNRSFCGRNGEAWVPAGAEALLPGTTLTAPSHPGHEPGGAQSQGRGAPRHLGAGAQRRAVWTAGQARGRVSLS